jgi:hypothetical protein
MKKFVVSLLRWFAAFAVFVVIVIASAVTYIHKPGEPVFSVAILKALFDFIGPGPFILSLLGITVFVVLRFRSQKGQK